MIHRYVLRDKARKLSEALAYDVFKGMHVTEKTAELGHKKVLVLKVVDWANKIDIKRAFERIFEIPVESVRTVVAKSKLRSFRGKWARRASFKKAMIRVKGDYDVSKILGVE